MMLSHCFTTRLSLTNRGFSRYKTANFNADYRYDKSWRAKNDLQRGTLVSTPYHLIERSRNSNGLIVDGVWDLPNWEGGVWLRFGCALGRRGQTGICGVFGKKLRGRCLGIDDVDVL